MHLLQYVGVGAIRERFSDQVCDLQHFLFFHVARCDGWRANADSTGFKDWVCVEWDTVLVYRDAGPVQNFLGFFAVNLLRTKIDEHQMIIGATGDDAVTVFCQAGSQRSGIQDNLPLIIAELGLERFVKANSLRCDYMHERATLHTGENGRIDLLGEFLFAHDDASTRAAQTLVRGGGDKLCVWDWT